MEEINNNVEDLFKTLFGTEEEQAEASQYQFSTESDVDDNIEAIKQFDTDIQRFKDLYKEKVEKLKCEMEGRIAKIDNKRQWILFNLKNSVMNSSDKKESKVQFKKSYLSGDIIVKKATVKLIKPELSEEEIAEQFPEFKKIDTKVTLNWAELKKQLKLVGNKVYNSKTGEDLSDVVLTETVPESVSVK